MIRKLRTALALTPGDWAALVAAWWVLWAVDVGLRLLSYSCLLGVIEWFTPEGRVRSRPPAARTLSRRCAALVDVAARHHLYPMSCLRQALALRWLLAVHGVSTQLLIGVHKNEDRLLAHAWLELAGTPLGEDIDVGVRYLPLTPSRTSP